MFRLLTNSNLKFKLSNFFEKIYKPFYPFPYPELAYIQPRYNPEINKKIHISRNTKPDIPYPLQIPYKQIPYKQNRGSRESREWSSKRFE